MVPGRLCAVCSEEDLARCTPRSLNYLQTTTVLVVSQITCKGRLTQIKTVPILFIDCWVGCVPSARLRAKPHPNHLTEIQRKRRRDIWQNVYHSLVEAVVINIEYSPAVKICRTYIICKSVPVLNDLERKLMRWKCEITCGWFMIPPSVCSCVSGKYHNLQHLLFASALVDSKWCIYTCHREWKWRKTKYGWPILAIPQIQKQTRRRKK